MKRLITIFSVVLTTLSTFAVTHANKWHSLIRIRSPFPSFSLQSYSVGNDTIIDGIKYFQINEYAFRYNEDSSRVYVHISNSMLNSNDSATIRTHMTNNEMLYYAYDVQPGDTLYTLALPLAWVRCNEVQAVTNNNGRRQVEMQYTDEEQYLIRLFPEFEPEQDKETDTWLEGIGSLHGMVCDPSEYTPGRESKLFCASFNDELLYRMDVDTYIETYKLIEKYNTYSIVSPCHEDVTVSLDEITFENKTTIIDTYNILGQSVDDTYHGLVIKNGEKKLQ